MQCRCVVPTQSQMVQNKHVSSLTNLERQNIQEELEKVDMAIPLKCFLVTETKGSC